MARKTELNILSYLTLGGIAGVAIGVILAILGSLLKDSTMAIGGGVFLTLGTLGIVSGMFLNAIKPEDEGVARLGMFIAGAILLYALLVYLRL